MLTCWRSYSDDLNIGSVITQIKTLIYERNHKWKELNLKYALYGREIKLCVVYL